MASRGITRNLLLCSRCHQGLELNSSKTLPCLHSFCHSCLNANFEGQENRRGHCPECQEPIGSDQLSLAQHLVSSLERLQLASAEWKCDLCFEDSEVSTAKEWCTQCQKLHCAICSRWHKKLHNQHNVRDLNQMSRCEVIKAMENDKCSLHQKSKDLHCLQCNKCFCNACYRTHTADSPGCLSKPLSVREEVSKKSSLGLSLEKQMDYLEIDLKGLIDMTRGYTVELNENCDLKCKDLWENFEEMRENAKQKTMALCTEVKQITSEQVDKWCHLLEENERILKQLEIWRLHLRHLLNESPKDEDVVCGLQLLTSKLSSTLHNPAEREGKCQLKVTLPNWWKQMLEQLKTENIGSVSLEKVKSFPAEKNITPFKEWYPQGSSFSIRSIQVSRYDDHVFLCCTYNRSIREYDESGEFVGECILKVGSERFIPWDMCQISPDVFVVAAGWMGEGNKLFLLERRHGALLKIKNIIDTVMDYRSLCKINQTLFLCDQYLQIDSFTKEGVKIKTIKTKGSRESCWPVIRADQSNGYLWLTVENGLELSCYNQNGDELISSKIKDEITDFGLNEFGDLYFCNDMGIYSFHSKKSYKFENTSEIEPRIFVSKNKLYVCLEIDERHLIKMFKISDVKPFRRPDFLDSLDTLLDGFTLSDSQ